MGIRYIKLTSGYRVKLGKSFSAQADIDSLVDQIRHAVYTALDSETFQFLMALLSNRAELAKAINSDIKLSSISTDVSSYSQLCVDDGKVYLEVALIPVLKHLGSKFRVCFYADEDRDRRVVVSGLPEMPAIELQEDISHHGSPCWDTVKILSTDPKDIEDFKLFSKVLDLLS